jgi:hypothetical protein
MRMVARGSSKLSRNEKTPVQPGEGVGRQVLQSRTVFARGEGCVQKCPDFLASDVERPTGSAPSLAHFVYRCSEELPFQGIKQRR